DVERFTRFTLGQLLDQAGRYDEAFETYARGNAMTGPGRLNTAESVTSVWTRDRLDAIPPGDDPADLPLLIVGMPRSGTTLVEQMLAAHPGVETVGESHTLPTLARTLGAGDLRPGPIHAIGRKYLASLQRVAEAQTRRVLDKMPGNYMHLGLLSRACPGARVIHTLRDPRDICLSCYFQNFGRTHTYARDLVLCAQQYVEHLKIMDHWREVTDLPILDLHYQSLVNDPETGVRRLLEFAGHEIDEACLRYHESDRTVTTASRDQVRQPVYKTSLARWKRYEKHIGPMTQALRDAGVELPDA
ncbi:MAG: sulfotransferase family protein, partial [Phycisphaerales bacterium JB059]